MATPLFGVAHWGSGSDCCGRGRCAVLCSGLSDPDLDLVRCTGTRTEEVPNIRTEETKNQACWSRWSRSWCWCWCWSVRGAAAAGGCRCFRIDQLSGSIIDYRLVNVDTPGLVAIDSESLNIDPNQQFFSFWAVKVIHFQSAQFKNNSVVASVWTILSPWRRLRLNHRIVKRPEPGPAV